MSSSSRWLTLIAAVLGLIGSGLLFYYSHTLVPHLGIMPGPGDNERINQINRRWRLWQRIGFGLLTASFLLQGIAVFT